MSDLEELQSRIPMQNIFTDRPAPDQRILLFITGEDITTHESETYAFSVISRNISNADMQLVIANSPEGPFSPITFYKLFDAQSTDPVPFFLGDIYVGEKQLDADNQSVLDRITSIQLPIRSPQGRRFTYFWTPEDEAALDQIRSMREPGPPAKKKGGNSKRSTQYRRSSLRKKRKSKRR